LDEAELDETELDETSLDQTNNWAVVMAKAPTRKGGSSQP